MVSLPEGFTSPKRTSANEYAVSVPPNHTLSIAGILLLSHSMAKGLPSNKARTIGLPVSNKALRSCFWTSGMLMSVLEEDSPDISDGSPRAAITTSDLMATATASSIICLSVRLSRGTSLPNIVDRFSSSMSEQMLLPLAYRNLTLSPSTSRKPSMTEVVAE